MRNAASRSLFPSTTLVSQGDDNDLEVIGPVPPNDTPDSHRFRVFSLTPTGQVDDSAGVDPQLVSHPGADVAGRLHIANPNEAYELRVSAPTDGGIWPWRLARMVVLACDGDRVVSVAQANVIESRKFPCIALAVIFTLLFHLVAGTMVYLARERAIRLADETEVTPPKRVVKLKHWSLWRCLNPVVMTSDEFDRGSLSNLQILFFVALVGYGMTNLALRTGVLSNLSPAIIYLLGIPAVGSLGNGIANVTRDRFSSENWAWLVNRGVLPANDPGMAAGDGAGPRWSDLIMTDTVLDMPKLQAMAFSLIVGVAMMATGFRHFADFDVPTSLLEILGLSQLVFVGGRFTQPTTIAEMDRMITELRKRAQDLIRAAASGVDVDADGKPRQPPEPATAPVRRGPFLSIERAASPDAVPNAVQRYIETEEAVTVMLSALIHRAIATEPLRDPLEWARHPALSAGRIRAA